MEKYRRADDVKIDYYVPPEGGVKNDVHIIKEKLEEAREVWLDSLSLFSWGRKE